MSELVKRGHILAAEVNDSSVEMLRSSIASMIRDLATQLDVQLARSNALAADNVGLKAAIDATIGWQQSTDPDNVESVRMLVDIKTPATGAFLAEVRAQGVEMLVKHCEQKALEKSYDFFMDAGAVAAQFAAQLRQEAQ
ncbi:hypothetical protein LWU69_05045 [Enterobacter hormaechei]|nr:hypothetical protein [Enterobacter hormaechei]MCE1453198.1 hypothetical protein [Enterobacter hormaechei]